MSFPNRSDSQDPQESNVLCVRSDRASKVLRILTRDR